MIYLLAVVMIIILMLIRLSMSIQGMVSTTSDSIVAAHMASRFPSGKVSYKEMEARDIHPYFCATERMVIWVQEPGAREKCPSCSSDIFAIYK